MLHARLQTLRLSFKSDFRCLRGSHSLHNSIPDEQKSCSFYTQHCWSRGIVSTYERVTTAPRSSNREMYKGLLALFWAL